MSAILLSRPSAGWLETLLLVPDTDLLRSFGAKDPVAIATGDWWRFITPVFVHIGLLHFAFNSYGIHIIGWQIERLLGTGWFLAIYLLSGVIGNVASDYFSLAISAGASGALFGLLGAGYVLERMVGNRIAAETGHRPKRRVYATMVGINLVFGAVVPGIDNAAHVGGLVSGALMTWAMLAVRTNRLRARNPLLAVAIGLLIIAVSAFGVGVSLDRNLVRTRIEARADAARSGAEAWYFYSEALSLNPNDPSLLVKRARILLLGREYGDAVADLTVVARNPDKHPQLEALAAELESQGFRHEGEIVRDVVASSITR